jgi:hypothetical protein
LTTTGYSPTTPQMSEIRSEQVDDQHVGRGTADHVDANRILEDRMFPFSTSLTIYIYVCLL